MISPFKHQVGKSKLPKRSIVLEKTSEFIKFMRLNHPDYNQDFQNIDESEVENLKDIISPDSISHQSPVYTTNKLKIAWWNINGVRAMVRKKNFEIFRELDPDIMWFTETLIDEAQLEKTKLRYSGLPCYPEMNGFWNCCKPPHRGYAGTL